MKSLSEKRLIVNGKVNGKDWPFLLDTGASIALIDKDMIKKAGLVKGKRYPGTIIGAGGELSNLLYCNTIVEFGTKQTGQFILTDISDIQESIYKETGYKILGIVSLPQMKFMGMDLDLVNNEVKFK